MAFRYLYAGLLTAGLFLHTTTVSAQEEQEEKEVAEAPEGMETKPYKPSKFYTSSALDGAIFSSALVTRPGKDNELSTLRFTYIFNFGVNFNYDFNKYIGLYTGVGIKNIGFIDKIGDSTIKRRVYTIGAPLGIKIGNLKKRKFGFIGGGVDIPFNYREKAFIKRGDKEKFNEWFSDRTPLVLPYVFAGVSMDPGITLKLQYYPTNFMNTDFTETTPSGITFKPYAGYKVNLILVSLGFDIHYTKQGKPKSVLVTDARPVISEKAKS